MSEAQSQIARYLSTQGKKPTYDNISGVLRALQTNPGLIPSLVVGPTEDSSPRATSNAPPQARAQTQRASTPTRPAQQQPAPTSSQSPAAAAADAAGRGNADAPSRSFTEPQSSAGGGGASGPVAAVSAQTSPPTEGGPSFVQRILQNLPFNNGAPGTGDAVVSGGGGGGGGAQAAPVVQPNVAPISTPNVAPTPTPTPDRTPIPAPDPSVTGEGMPITMDGIQRALSTADDALRSGGARAEAFLQPRIDRGFANIGRHASDVASFFSPSSAYQGSDATAADTPGPSPASQLLQRLGGTRGAPDPMSVAPAPGGADVQAQPTFPVPPAVRNLGRDIGNKVGNLTSSVLPYDQSGAKVLLDALSGSGQPPQSNEPPGDSRNLLARIMAGLGIGTQATLGTSTPRDVPGRTPRQPPSRQ